MAKKNVVAMVFLLGLTVLAGGAVSAQNTNWNQQTACPGWNNPASFTVGGAPTRLRARQVLRQ